MAKADEPSQRMADLYSRLTGQLRRCLETLGLERKQKTISALEITRALSTVPTRPLKAQDSISDGGGS
jgi:hypothetical protein